MKSRDRPRNWRGLEAAASSSLHTSQQVRPMCLSELLIRKTLLQATRVFHNIDLQLFHHSLHRLYSRAHQPSQQFLPAIYNSFDWASSTRDKTPGLLVSCDISPHQLPQQPASSRSNWRSHRLLSCSNQLCSSPPSSSLAETQHPEHGPPSDGQQEEAVIEIIERSASMRAAIQRRGVVGAEGAYTICVRGCRPSSCSRREDCSVLRFNRCVKRQTGKCTRHDAVSKGRNQVQHHVD